VVRPVNTPSLGSLTLGLQHQWLQLEELFSLFLVKLSKVSFTLNFQLNAMKA
jgi:hypothetical protein